MHFNDFLYFGTIYLRLKIQEEKLIEKITFADIIHIDYSSDPIIIQVKLPRSCKIPLKKQNCYLLKERLVDFNIKKVIQNFMYLDNNENCFIPLLKNVIEFNHLQYDNHLNKSILQEEENLFKLYKENYQLNNNRTLHFLPSQRKAFQFILKNNFSIIWGPPGTGKTYTLALSMLRLLEIMGRISKCKTPYRILMTAFTNAAILNFLEKFNKLKKERESLKDIQRSEWLELTEIIVLKQENDNNFPDPNTIKCYSIICGSVWQIHKWQEKFQSKFKNFFFDLLLIDEASQLPVAGR